MLYYPIGKSAKTPYFIRSLGVRVYTIEELSFCIIDNVLRMDESFMDAEMINFISKDLGLSDLAKNLSDLYRAGDLALFCAEILEYTRFVDSSQIASITGLLKENQSLSAGMRHLRRGDYYFKNDMIIRAIPEYKEAIYYFGSDADNKHYAIGLHNMGSAYAKLFEFDQAAKCFLESFEISSDDESYNLYLACLRLGKTKDDYLSIVHEEAVDEEILVALEDWIGVLLEESANDDVNLKFRNAIRKKAEGNTSEYYADINSILCDWKEKCRRNLELENI